MNGWMSARKSETLPFQPHPYTMNKGELEKGLQREFSPLQAGETPKGQIAS